MIALVYSRVILESYPVLNRDSLKVVLNLKKLAARQFAVFFRSVLADKSAVSWFRRLTLINNFGYF